MDAWTPALYDLQPWVCQCLLPKVVSALMRMCMHTQTKPTITNKLFLLSFMPLSLEFNLYGCPQIQKGCYLPSGLSHFFFWTGDIEVGMKYMQELASLASHVLYLKRENVFSAPWNLANSHTSNFSPWGAVVEFPLILYSVVKAVLLWTNQEFSGPFSFCEN